MISTKNYWSQLLVISVIKTEFIVLRKRNCMIGTLEIYSTIQINRTCPINRRVQDDIDKVYEIFRGAYKPENYDILGENFKALARGLAGHATDKIWLL